MDAKIFVAGHRGLVGSAITRRLEAQGCTRIIKRTRAEVDLTRQADVEDLFRIERPEFVFLAAARVGGILANHTYPADFIYDNLAIQANVLHAAWKNRVSRLIFLGSSCVYPRDCPQPIKEEYLLTGKLEATNEPYAVAKIAGIIQCGAYNRQYGTRFLTVMPTNLYGVNDNFDLQTSHVLPALIRKFHLARLALAGDWDAIQRDENRYGPIPEDISKAIGFSRKDASAENNKVALWGSGTPRREFLHVDDLANACVFLMNLSEEEYTSLLDDGHRPIVNIGCGEDLTIRELAALTAEIVGYRGEVAWDRSKPDGTPRKLLDVSRLKKLGWGPSITLREGIAATYDEYRRSAGP